MALSFASFTGLRATGPVSVARASSSAPAAGRSAVFTVQAGQDSRKVKTQNRHRRMRNKIEGTAERPRLSVYRSNEHIYAQVIDDIAQKTLAHTSSLSPALKEGLGSGATVEAASKVGGHIAELCAAANIEKVVFDRGGKLYHGRIKAVAEAAREKGLVF